MFYLSLCIVLKMDGLYFYKIYIAQGFSVLFFNSAKDGWPSEAPRGNRPSTTIPGTESVRQYRFSTDSGNPVGNLCGGGYMTGEMIALGNPWEQIKARLTTRISAGAY